MNESPLAMMAETMQDFMKNIPAGSPLRAAQNPAVAKEIGPVLGVMLQSGNEPSSQVALSDLQNRFSLHLPLIQRSIFTVLKNAGYYLHRPDQFRPAIGVLGVLVGFLMLPVGMGLAVQTGTSPLPWIASAILSGVIIWVFARFMSGRTVKGARTYAKVLGFEEFLTRVEKDQIARLDNAPELFEKYLPYAMALQVEKRWVQAFGSIGMQAPQWYQGSYDGGFQPSLLVNDLGVMSSHAGDVMSSSARSSGGVGASSSGGDGTSSSGATSGSGFSDSGSSGGGFGGGGGGGFLGRCRICKELFHGLNLGISRRVKVDPRLV